MYRILDAPTEAPTAHSQAVTAEIGKAVEISLGAGSAADRHDHGPVMVCLTESKVSWASSAAFELRWTSLAA